MLKVERLLCMSVLKLGHPPLVKNICIYIDALTHSEPQIYFLTSVQKYFVSTSKGGGNFTKGKITLHCQNFSPVLLVTLHNSLKFPYMHYSITLSLLIHMLVSILGCGTTAGESLLV